MKVKDLMVGDWVKTNPNCGKLTCGIKSNIAMVSEIGFSNSDGMYVSFGGINGRYYDNELEPIPLTEEILEKNGFTSVEDPYNHKKYFLLGKNEYNYDVYLDGLTILLADEEYEPATYAYICDVNYVHELQHLLKQCKIEKGIVL